MASHGIWPQGRGKNCGHTKAQALEDQQDAIQGKCGDHEYKITILGQIDVGSSESLNESLDEDFHPDKLWTFYPTIMIEIGFSQSYVDLIEDAKHWLLLTPHHPVLSVIIFKFQKPENGEPGDIMNFQNWSLFFEIWQW